MQTQQQLKCRTDILIENSDRLIVVDVKKTRDASPEPFGRQADELMYGFSAAHYCEGLSKIAQGRPIEWYWIAIDPVTTQCAIYYATQAAMDANRKMWRKALDTYVQCHKTNEFPPIKGDPQPLFIPKYSRIPRL
jgi:PDDEXK-like domain of unknown function (DUF3799)